MNRFNHRRMLIFSVLIITLLMAGLAQAQDEAQDQDQVQAPTPNGNRAGFFLGLNFANQGGDMDEMGQMLADELGNSIGGTWTSTKGSNMGLGFGGFYTIQTSPTFGVQIEGQFIRRGTKLDLKVTDGFSSMTLETEFQLNYLEIPLLARFSPSPDAKFRPLFMAGPVIGFKTGANLKMSFEGESESESISEGYKSTTVGLLGAVGFSAQVGQASFLTVQGRYYMGLTNPIDDPNLEAKSSDFGIFAGLEFLLK